MFCLNVFLPGVLFCLLIRHDGNFWIATGIHTGWNYTQTYLLGISGSGETAPIGTFVGTVLRDSPFYQEVYGYEGALSTTVLVLILIEILIVLLMKKKELSHTAA